MHVRGARAVLPPALRRPQVMIELLRVDTDVDADYRRKAH
eukprot:COSAG06_NODE_671_length_13206_cov_477.269474_17_plen_40_part_00